MIMQKQTFIRANLLLCLNAMGVQGAAAQPRLVVNLSAETRDFGEDRGSLDSAVLEYKVEDGDTTVVFAPTYGERHAAGTNYTAAGFDGAIYQRWSDSISTRSEIFVAEDSPVFATFDFSQDVTVRIARNDTLTAGARWARYFGGHNVAFQSIGLRHYFPRGSVAYRMTRINPDNRDSFLGHLVNLSINDAQGAGKTQLWLGTGGASFDRVQAEDITSGNDNSIVIQRYQPIFGKFSLVGTAGVTSYSRPEGRTTGSNFRLGMVVPVS
jgi:YaiO family outer membrane protein